jgi:hypothetical protein
MGKLRAALDVLVSLAPITTEPTQELSVTGKRSLGGHEDDGEGTTRTIELFKSKAIF